MARKRYEPDEIVNLLRQAEVRHGQGMSMADGSGSSGSARLPSTGGARSIPG